MDKNMLIGSLAMDLKRVGLSLHRGSLVTANRFKLESNNRIKELEHLSLEDSLRKIINYTKKSLSSKADRAPEDILMYSTLLQNFVAKNSSIN